MPSNHALALKRVGVAMGLAVTVAATHAEAFADVVIAPEVAAARAHAESLLSQRYASLWARLPTDQRAALSARERQWLNVDRWRENDACIASRGPASGTACLTEVTLRHALTLPETGDTEQHASRSGR